jgi:MoxR-like ATPase
MADQATTSDHPDAERTAALVDAVVGNVRQVIQGKDDVVALAAICLVAEGHLLVEDVPGVGKTSLAKALATSIDATYGRIQFTPDLLPADVVGVTVWNRGVERFDFRPGPVFTNILVADEINRASPKTQSALLEAMAEGQVTVDNQTRPLAAPFLVMATQNPVEHEGTYPLPESQLDRFLMRISVGYPDRDAELAMLEAHGEQDALERIGPVTDTASVLAAQEAARHIHVAPSLRAYLVALADATRRHNRIQLPVSPRGTLALMRAARARAAAAGRGYVVPDDIKALVEPVLAHRMLVTPEAQLAGTSPADALAEAVRSVPVPAGRR